MTDNKMLEALVRRTMRKINEQVEPAIGLIGVAIKMRAAQQLYAASKSPRDLNAARAAENRFDRTIEEFEDALRGE